MMQRHAFKCLSEVNVISVFALMWGKCSCTLSSSKCHHNTVSIVCSSCTLLDCVCNPSENKAERFDHSRVLAFVAWFEMGCSDSKPNTALPNAKPSSPDADDISVTKPENDVIVKPEDKTKAAPNPVQKPVVKPIDGTVKKDSEKPGSTPIVTVAQSPQSNNIPQLVTKTLGGSSKEVTSPSENRVATQTAGAPTVLVKPTPVHPQTTPNTVNSNGTPILPNVSPSGGGVVVADGKENTSEVDCDEKASDSRLVRDSVTSLDATSPVDWTKHLPVITIPEEPTPVPLPTQTLVRIHLQQAIHCTDPHTPS